MNYCAARRHFLCILYMHIYIFIVFIFVINYAAKETLWQRKERDWEKQTRKLESELDSEREKRRTIQKLAREQRTGRDNNNNNNTRISFTGNVEFMDNFDDVGIVASLGPEVDDTTTSRSPGSISVTRSRQDSGDSIMSTFTTIATAAAQVQVTLPRTSSPIGSPMMATTRKSSVSSRPMTGSNEKRDGRESSPSSRSRRFSNLVDNGGDLIVNDGMEHPEDILDADVFDMLISNLNVQRIGTLGTLGTSSKTSSPVNQILGYQGEKDFRDLSELDDVNTPTIDNETTIESLTLGRRLESKGRGNLLAPLPQEWESTHEEHQNFASPKATVTTTTTTNTNNQSQRSNRFSRQSGHQTNSNGSDRFGGNHSPERTSNYHEQEKANDLHLMGAAKYHRWVKSLFGNIMELFNQEDNVNASIKPSHLDEARLSQQCKKGLEI